MDGEPRRGGRPRKSEGPRDPYEELDRILVFGEVVPCEDGNGTTVVYPSYRELAERYGVSNSVIAEYAKTHNVQRRRREAQARARRAGPPEWSWMARRWRMQRRPVRRC